MRTIEAIGKNVEDAISKGLAQLGITREEAQIMAEIGLRIGLVLDHKPALAV